MDQNQAQDQQKGDHQDGQLNNLGHAQGAMTGQNAHSQQSQNFQHQSNQNQGSHQNYEHAQPDQNGSSKNLGQDCGENQAKSTYAQQQSHDPNAAQNSQRNIKMQQQVPNAPGYQQHPQQNPMPAPHMMQHPTQSYNHQPNNQAYPHQQQPKIGNGQMQQHGPPIPAQHAAMQHQQRPPPQQQHGYAQHQMQAQQYPQQYAQNNLQQQYQAQPDMKRGPNQPPNGMSQMNYGMNQSYGQQQPQPQNPGASTDYYNQYLPYIKYQQQQLELHQQKKKQQQSSPSKEPNTNILDKARLKEMCGELCGNRDVLDEKVSNVLALMVDQMVENIVDYSCMYARHRDSDTLEKEDVQFAVSRLFPEKSRDHKVRDIELAIDQQVNANHPNVNQVSSVANLQNQPGGGIGANIEHTGTSIGVAGQISTANYKGQLLRVRREQDQRSMISNLQKNLKSNTNNADHHQLGEQRRPHPSGPGLQNQGDNATK